ncbi:hypothetical protein LWI28_020069 [Acer negundo]|uniref:ubiquitinyl hydrolase 1 n=1 Tax=Acer negundo TaxID=4023 RepID=A0AAD5NM08_ACENE|nr:hypothetical protein LWI28_020069 [Acer negundo]
MLVPGILGFQGLLFISLFLFFLFIRQKWKNAEARKAEIAQLLAVAAEESFMAEVEFANQYIPMPKLYQCAVCFSPTTTRCSRCKAVRYCSGKCQILHWRQGHKDECCPTTMPLNEGNDIIGLAASPQQFKIPGNDSEIAGKFEARSNASSMMDEDVNPKPCIDVEGKHTGFASYNSSISSLPGSGSGSTRGRSDLLVGVSSANEGLGSSTVVRPDPAAPDLPGKRVKIKKIKKTTGPSLESTNSVIPLQCTSRASKLDKMKLGQNNEEVNCRSQLPNGKTATTDDIKSSKLGSKKSTGGTASPELLVKDTSKARGSSSLSCSRSDYVTKENEDDSKLHKGKKDRSLSPSMVLPASATGEHSVGSSKSVLPVNVSSIPSLPQNAHHGLKTSVRKVVQQFLVSKPLKSYLLGSENEVAEKYSDKTIFPYDLFLKLYSYDEVELCPFGLTNCGNSCYANAVLQCLAFTRPLTSYLVQGLHSRICQKKGWCFICEFERLILKAREGNSPLSPISILSKIQKIGSHLGHGREEDAHEFLRCAVDTMQSVCLKEAGAAGLLAEHTTLVGLTFGGYLRSKIKCLKCHGKSEQYERMMDLTVEIDGDIGTLEDALAQFTTSETLVGENKYYCSRCKSYEKAKKKLSILEEPNILTIVLKRFQSGNFGKLSKSVRFPEVLNMAPYMSGSNDKSAVYSLYAVVVHLDVMDAAFSGHYVCYVKNSHGQWFRIDDSTVMPVELETVLLEEAYMLLYARHSPRLPALIRNNFVSHGTRSKKRNVEAVPSGLNASKLRSNSSIPSVDSKAHRKLGSTSNQFFDQEEWRYQLIQQRIPRVDSSSESSSIFSSSDASSCSTASTKGSSRSEDLSDFIFGDMGPSWYSRYEIPSNSVTSSSYQNYENENDGWGHGWREDLGRDGKPAILYNTNSSKHYRNLSQQFVSSSNREIESGQVVWDNNPYNVRLRRAGGDRSAQTFYCGLG